jgi:hypothetical protein
MSTSRKQLETEALEYAERTLGRKLNDSERRYVKDSVADMYAGTLDPDGDCIPSGWVGDADLGALRSSES